jgi:hypothetical protein
MKNILERGKSLLSSRSPLVRGLAIAGAVMVFGLATATAAFQLRVSISGGPTFLVTDQDFVPVFPDTNPDGAPLPGVVSLSTSSGVFVVTVNTAVSRPVLGDVGHPEIDLNSIHVVAGGAGTITVEATDTGFNAAGPLVGLAGGTLIGPAGSSATFDAWTNAGNVPFSHAGAHLTLGPVGPGAFALAGSVPGGNAGSMTLQSVFVFTGSGSGSYDFDARVVPEGSSLAMLLPGLLPIGLIMRRRMKKA